MARAVSKNSRTRKMVEKFYCPCGGQIKMYSHYDGKVKYFAKCDECGTKKRRPSDFK